LDQPDIRFGSKREQSDQRYTFVHVCFALKATVDLKHRLAVRHNATSSACGDKNVCASEQSFIK